MKKPQRSDMVEPVETFAQLLRMRRRLPEWKMRLPPWFAPVSARQDQDTLTPEQQGRFICALNVRIADGTFGALVDIHADMSHHMHAMPAPGDPTGAISQQRFLPWHRAYLHILEQSLQAIHPDVTIPYWDWTKPSEQAIPGWLVSFTPTVTTPTRTIHVTRGPGPASWLATIASNVPSVMNQTDYTDFATQLESVHDGVHVWVGGTMGVIATAPADLIFWMHHANIDRLWWTWFNSPKGTGQNPNLSGVDLVLDPWAYTEPMTRDIGSLGYAYI